MRSVTLFVLQFFFVLNIVWAADGVKISQIRGDVRIRIGMEEEWQKAQIGMMLKDLDTIFSGENSHVELLNQDGQGFTLEANSILDISDLRQIQERELFIFLMNQKVDQLEIQDEKTKIRMGNVSVVHSESKEAKSSIDTNLDIVDWYEFETNGAQALFDHAYYPNAIIKYHRIKNRYSRERDQGFLDYHIGTAFEAMNNDGQALDSYQSALNTYLKQTADDEVEPGWVKDTRMAVKRLTEQ